MSHPSAQTVLLTQEQVAQRLGVKPATLQIWRVTGRYSLPFVKCARVAKRLSNSARDAPFL